MAYEKELKTLIETLKNNCDEWTCFVAMSGNEDSYTDSIISKIIDISEVIKKIDTFRFNSKATEDDEKQINELLSKNNL